MPENIIQMRHVHKWFGKVHALDDVSMDVAPGEVLVIVGPSGSGKSTLLRTVNHLEAVNSGEIIVDGIQLTHKSTDINAVRAEVGMVFQQFNLFPHLTALQNITLAQRIVRRRSSDEADRVARELLERVGIPEKADSFPGQLSGGQQQRVAIARALAMNPKIMLFDEADQRADPEMIKEVLDVMLDLAQSGHAVVTHEMGPRRATPHRVRDRGNDHRRSRPNSTLRSAQTQKTKAFLSNILERHLTGSWRPTYITIEEPRILRCAAAEVVRICENVTPLT